MKPQFLKISSDTLHSFNARKDTMPDVNNKWHYHMVLELIYFRKGTGTQYVGNSIERFKEGDVALIGKNLPHYWLFDAKYFENPKRNKVEIFVIHFGEHFWGEEFLKLPENQTLKKTLALSSRGFQIKGETKDKLTQLIPEIVESDWTRKIIRLLEALHSISESAEYEFLTSANFKYHFDEDERHRIMDIYNYTLSNYTQKITLEDVSEIANLSPNSFCKFFKSRTGKTYTQFVNEIRIGDACQKLIENQMSVKEVCFASGFNNFTSFHECFKNITGKSPLKYQQLYRK
ncbi:AraC family transcriptional regulator [Elizabethkingia anophelis]|uniref:AraC family transcriptional regulator n=1 Tax=Elizabethkingia anophelis TaxID=1117645 RepID=UPI00099A26F2|nr:AraC family transcriptional regulator [Elizabethkingia anophelis]MDV4129398.1 AraC family transcriptional regulator [Elizabethkingia anophelis]MDV4133197.1 AraC family transcriptional regulator [Elizabethkingia anophelis]OPC64104.1 transcriptional regulator [Elizabethkingia anophelis]